MSRIQARKGLRTISANQSLKDFEDLIRVIHERHDGMSKTYKNIAVYLTQNPNEVAIKTVNAIAESCGIHASSFVRFAQSLGYEGFKDLQEVFQRRLSTAAPGFEARIKALESELVEGELGGAAGFLRELVLRDIASLQELMASVSQESLTKGVGLLEKADTIYLIGQLRSAPVVELLRYVLSMVGKRTVLLDASGGLATHMAKLMTPRDLLIAVSFRFYARETSNVAEDVAGRGVPVLAITDSTLSPLAKNARVLFTVPEHEYTFSRSLAAPMCLAQALVVSLASKLQKKSAPRIPTVTQP
jgi:DNA-binding MurR/RpiR family transcriptional regulator